ncbi:MAG TPA: UDP-N-acetylmuramoyl-L-alanine--D-glutamate ligase, partial [Solirubrobacteraceae bacterium]|nr:UDP-N-acetylmuramoyl-L-alanine--D-glutamate ligase [Solirubrobacteraceae bacterium]
MDRRLDLRRHWLHDLPPEQGRLRPRPPVPDGVALVVGLARSGAAAALALAAAGREVIGVDAGEPAEARALGVSGIELHLADSGEGLLGRAGLVVKSPGVPRRAPPIAGALARGIPVLGELELAWRMLANEFIAVTGTNGKTTTVELVGHIHREAGAPAAVAGNVGTAVSSLVGHVGPDATIVCEASSFQLEDTLAFAPEGAVLLNIEPDHLDRHGTLEAYTRAKLEIFARQGNDDLAVAPQGLGVDDLGGCARRVCFGAGPGAALSERAGQLWWEERPLLDVQEIRLRGAHNVHNAMAAAAVCLARGLEVDAVRAGLRSFAGVAHRLEEVAIRHGVLYVNDSKATNVASTRVALAAFADGPGVHLILGGQSKGQDFAPLRAPVAATCRGVYLIGEDAPLIARAL